MEFRTPDICKMFSINRNNFQMWIDRKHIRASIHEAERNGDPYIFSLLDLLAIKIFQHLIKDGVRKKESKKIIDCLYYTENEKKLFLKLTNFLSTSNNDKYLICIIIKVGDKCNISLVDEIISLNEKYCNNSSLEYVKHKLNHIKIIISLHYDATYNQAFNLTKTQGQVKECFRNAVLAG